MIKLDDDYSPPTRPGRILANDLAIVRITAHPKNPWADRFLRPAPRYPNSRVLGALWRVPKNVSDIALDRQRPRISPRMRSSRPFQKRSYYGTSRNTYELMTHSPEYWRFGFRNIEAVGSVSLVARFHFGLFSLRNYPYPLTIFSPRCYRAIPLHSSTSHHSSVMLNNFGAGAGCARCHGQKTRASAWTPHQCQSRVPRS